MGRNREESWTLQIRGFAAQAFVGIREVEKVMRQKVTIDVDVVLAAPGEGEDPMTDYDDVLRFLRIICDQERFGLLEHLADRVAKMLKDEFGAHRVRVRCAKPKVHADVEEVRVVLERG